jgi:hypothetical protein
MESYPAGTKKCPFCAEDILEQAVYCRYCKRDLNSSIIQLTTEDTVSKSGNNNKIMLGIGLVIVVLLVIILVAVTGKNKNVPVTNTESNETTTSNNTTTSNEYSDIIPEEVPCTIENKLNYLETTIPIMEQLSDSENLMNPILMSHKYDEITRLKPPVCFENLHENFQQGVYYGWQAAEAASRGDYDVATNLLEKTNYYIGLATAELDTLNGN